MTTYETRLLFPYATSINIDKFCQPLTDTMQRFEINTPKRIAAFVAQLAHESGSLKYVREIASGNAYEGRKDLGNTQTGDGPRFKGRGLIQLTGRANYQKASEFFQVDFVANPELVETPHYAAMIAGWYWHRHNLNQLADIRDFRKITRIINGGYNGMADRQKHYDHACAVLGI